MLNQTDENHIGAKAWRRLSRNQQRAIINDRKNGRKIATEFVKRKFEKLYPHSIKNVT
jgi:hypothetical protein